MPFGKSLGMRVSSVVMNSRSAGTPSFTTKFSNKHKKRMYVLCHEGKLDHEWNVFFHVEYEGDYSS